MSKRPKNRAYRNGTVKSDDRSKGPEVAHFAKVTKLLRPTDTPLLTAVSRYAQAVRILGGDLILEAARKFARQNHKLRKPRKLHKTRKLRKPRTSRKRRAARTRRTIRKARVIRKRLIVRKPNKVRKPAAIHQPPVRPIAEQMIVVKKRRAASEPEPITICTPNELRGLLAAAPGWFRPILAIQAFAGLHTAELLRLDWEDVKLDRGHIEVGKHRATAGARRLAPIPPNLVRWLTYAAKTSGKVFPYSRTNLEQIQADTATAAEVGWKDNALRHSFISYRVAQTSDVPRVSLESGTSPGRIFKHYRTLVGEMEARQWFIIAP